MSSEATGPYARYWKIWGVLLGVTVLMITVDTLEMPAGILLPVLLAAMLFKASLICWEFMHLREEPRALAFLVAFAVLFLGSLLFAVIAPDGLRILHDVAP